ncbi:hypothetical protein BSKO_10547 [Bryopsis sp. KO-2023]|nr:hypothetical protein BSKO_10547 [Bryopsis sp. KO-2023]
MNARKEPKCMSPARDVGTLVPESQPGSPISPLPSPSASLNGHYLGKTAQIVAACRATETGKPADAGKLHDPWAINFAGVAGMEILETIRKFSPGTAAALEGYVVERTLFLDGVLNETLAQPDMRQVVVAAVGGDARPYRIAFPQGTVLYEMDLPEVLRYRFTVFGRTQAKAACDLRSLGVDLSQDTWHHELMTAGFDPSKPSVWIVEGLLMYLTTNQCGRLIAKIGSLCQPGSLICGDLFTEEFVTYSQTKHVHNIWHDCGASRPDYYIEEPQMWFSKFDFGAHLKKCKDLGAGWGVEEKVNGVDFDVSLMEDSDQSPRPLFFKATKQAT